MTCLMKWLSALVLLVMATTLVDAGNITESSAVLSRKKRLIYLTSERRLTLPPETLMVLTPTLSLPMGRNLPTGYGASMTISIPFKIAFDDLGLTSEENPWGLWPDIFFRKKRETFTPLPGVNWAGGDREMMYQVAEDALSNMGVDGKACLLRAICEVFQRPLVSHGFFGEVLELFLSASRSPHAEKRLNDYTGAERKGRSTGECTDYHFACPFSLFTNPGHMQWVDENNMDHDGGSSSASSDTSKPVDFFGEIQRNTSDKTGNKKSTENTKKRKTTEQSN